MSAATQSDPTTTTQVYRVYISAPAQRIWDAITQPEWTERFGYGGRSVYELRPGGAYTAYTSQAMRDQGAPEVAIVGEVLESDPPRRLVQTWHMVMDPAMEAQGATRLTYEIEELPDGVSRLTVVHDLAGAPVLAGLMRGDMERQGAGGGWNWVLSTLKTLLETGEELGAR
jgi:uncharacterized protein YndB with AHSA1/START domain